MKQKSTQILYKTRWRFLQLGILLCLFLYVPFFAIAQNKIQATGVVTSQADNQTMPGVSIVVKGTTNGTITDLDGKFTITVNEGETLVFSYIGFVDEEFVVTNANPVTMALVPDLVGLDEVVVIGYGVQKKKLVTGATAQVKGDELQKQNQTNALQAMQGRTPGVNITSQSGQPGEGMKVIIRGVGTINNAGPLYIVDGVQVGDIKNLNNNDIESIDVLKDAASAAIYGTQGANGVILVTTKQGKAGKSQITFDAYYGIQNRAKKINMLNSKEYTMIMNEAYINSGGDKNGTPFDIANLPQYTQNGPASTDWVDEMFVKNSVIQNYSIGATGGSETGTYAISLGYMGQEGIVGGSKVSNYGRYNGRVNSEHKLYNDRVKVGEHISFSHTKKNGIGVGNQYSNTLRGAFNTSPLMPVYDDNGNYFSPVDTSIHDINPNSKTFGDNYWNITEGNPYAMMMLTNQNIAHTQNLLADVYSEIELISNLKLRSTLGIDFSSYDYRSYTPVYSFTSTNFNDDDDIKQRFEKDLNWSIDNVLTYNIAVNEHKFDLMIGNSIRKSNGSSMEGSNSIGAYSDFKHAWLSNATNIDNASMYSLSGGPDDDNKMLSYFGRIQYNFKETYMFNVVFRADGSSKFASGHQWGYFPSLSAGWVISNESFMESTASYLNFLKLRGSWGRNGNCNVDAYKYLATIAFTKGNYPFGDTEGTNTNGSFPDQLANEKLKWETSEQLDFGFDSRFLDSKLNLEFDWYRKTTNDWLIEAPVIATSGMNNLLMNGGNVINTGIECNIGYDNNIDKLHYNISANGAYNKNKVTDIPTIDGIIHGAKNSLYANSSEFYRAEKSHPIGYFWGYKTNGIFQTNAEITEYQETYGKTLQSKPQPGDVRFVDSNGDGVITEKDKSEIGDPNPDLVYGLTISLDYKALDFSIVTNGVMGNQIVQSYHEHSSQNSNYTTEILGRWKGQGTSNRIPRVTTGNINYQFSDLFVQDGDYFRISNVTLGFDVAKVVKLKNLSQCRFYASVQNLYTFTNYTGMDAEVGYGLDNGSTDRFSSGVDLGFYPRPKTVMFGVNVKF